jgi:hypothetical protein
MRRISRALHVLILLALSAAAAPTIVVYPRSASPNDSQYVYDYELLRVALARTERREGPVEVRESAVAMNQSRAAEEIMAGSGSIHVFARSTTMEHEARMLPVRIPLDKGLVSYRLFLIRAADQPKFSAVRTLDHLRQFRAGSFTTWADTRILRDGGFQVVTGDSYEGLFHMLMAERFDFFSRSVDEAFRELEERKETLPGMRIEETILLHFPTTRYFFVRRSPEGEKLARRIEEGLEAMIRDGSFDEHFRRHKGPAIARAGLGARRLFRIPNAHLSPETPLARRELWFDPIAGR